MVNEVTSGTGMSPWEAQVVIEVIREVYFATPGNAPLRHGQLLYTCVKVEAGAGVALKDCPMTRVTLSLMGEGDDQIHGAEMLRRHRIGRFCEEARDQGGLLTHKGVAIRHWLEGKEPQEVARAINHSLRAVERYLNHFARIIYCVSHGFSVLQTAFALGISNASVRAYLDIYEEFKDKEGFRLRVAELEAIGAAHHESGDAKKGALLAPEKWINSSQKGASKP